MPLALVALRWSHATGGRHPVRGGSVLAARSLTELQRPGEPALCTNEHVATAEPMPARARGP
jgi:hypothetical protein